MAFKDGDLEHIEALLKEGKADQITEEHIRELLEMLDELVLQNSRLRAAIQMSHMGQQPRHNLYPERDTKKDQEEVTYVPAR